MRPCLSDDEILGFVGGATTASERPPIHDHLGDCSRCRVLVAQTRKGLTMLPETKSTSGNDTLDDSDLDWQPVPVGSQIGRYQVGTLLGSGGAGLVYEAFDPQLSRKVALKILRPDKRPNADTDARRMLREARAMAQLSHPAVVAVYDAGNFAGGVFIAMELVQGRTLSRWLSETERGWQAIVSQFVAAGQGLVAAHTAGLIHRDFKAENVLVGGDGRPRVTDFGLARASQPTNDGEREPDDGTGNESLMSVRSFLLTLTEAAAFAGTPAYMAPEQFRGARADQATDQFNFCASLYVALYHQPPFADDGERSLPNLASAVVAGRLRRVPNNSPVPQAFFSILTRGLASDRSARFPSMVELLHALNGALAPRQTAPLPRTSRLVLWGSAAAALLATGYGAYRWTQVDTIQVVSKPAPAKTIAPPEAHSVTMVKAGADEAATAQKAPKTSDGNTRRRGRTQRAGASRPATSAPPVLPTPVPSPLLDGIKNPYDR